VVIPNRKIVGEILHNYGGIRQLDLVVGVAYDTDIGAALSAIDEVLRTHGKVLTDPAPVIRVSALADSSVHISVMPWVAIADYGAAGGELNRAILESLRARRIVIPFPQREVRLLGREAG
jgi:small conductance mechanosensitive channel